VPPCATSSREGDFHVLEAGDLAEAVEAAGDVWPHVALEEALEQVAIDARPCSVAAARLRSFSGL
jgi:hypothetical protein